jgi:tRNA A-37 threonylcarbamoyl transferase component Bud32
VSGPEGEDRDDGKLGEAETVDASSPAAPPTPTPTGERTPDGATSPSARGTLAVGPGTVLGRYLVGDELGAGGMATVYKARDEQLRRDVAVKVMFPHLAKKPEVSRRFRREARAAAGLEHQNILRVYDVGGGPDEPPYIVMELVRGKSLRELGDANGPMLAEVVACIGAVLCDALAAAHAGGVIHRDVKPANVMTTDDGRLLLADFGVARVDDDDSLVTRTGALLGTPSFMSPEQAQGDEVDGRSDVYSVGATLYQLATGSSPFSGTTAVVVAAILRGEYTAPQRRRPQIGAEVSRAIQKLMSKERAARPASAAEAATLLRQIAKDAGFGEARDEVAAYLRDPAAFEAARTPRVVERSMERAREAQAAGNVPRALALIDRVLAIVPDHADATALAEKIQRGDRRRRVLVGGLIGLCVAALGTGVFLLAAGHSHKPAAADAATATAAAAAADAAAAAAAAADAAAVPAADAATAAASAPIDAGRHHKATVDAGVALPQPPPDAAPHVVAPPPPDAAPAPPAQGSITLVLDAWCDLSIDGTSLGRLDKKKSYPVDPGSHEIVCTQGQGLATFTQTVTVAAGAHKTVKGSLLGVVHVTVAVSGGDAVRIAGATHANGATVDLKPGRFRIEVMQGGTSVTSGYIDLPRIASCTLKDRPDLDCYP